MLTTSQLIASSSPVRELVTQFDNTVCQFGTETVNYTFGEDLREASSSFLEDLAPSSVVLVYDNAVSDIASHYAKRWQKIAPTHIYPMNAIEAEKTLERMSHLMNWVLQEGADRNTVIVAMGGGMVGNIVGLAAHLLFRGLKLIHMPTTYMAAFDSVLSQKQAVNGCGTKNMIGAFHVPEAIFCDSRFFVELPVREVRAGLVESIKNALIAEPSQADVLLRLPSDPAAFGAEEHHLIWGLSIEAKVPRMAEDPKEKGPALIFEYGHTLGHAIEASAMGQLRHGEAVALGLSAVARLAQIRFGISAEFVDLHDTLLDHFGIGRILPAGVSYHAVEEQVRKDNKRGYLTTPYDHVAMVIANKPGGVLVTEELPLVPVPVSTVMDACATLVDG